MEPETPRSSRARLRDETDHDLVPLQATFALLTISRSRLSCALRFRQVM